MTYRRLFRSLFSRPVAAVLTCAVSVLGCAAPSAPPASSGGVPSPSGGVASSPDASPPDAGASATGSYRVESSLGVQIEVPSHWGVNDYGCNMTDRPSVVRGVGAQTLCLTPEKPTKEVAIIGTAAETSGQLSALAEPSTRRVRLGDVEAERGEGRAADGRWVGWLRLSSRGVTVVVKTLKRSSMQRILDSAKLAPIDQHGCPERRPVKTAGAATGTGGTGAEAPLVPANPSSIAICYYGDIDDRLKSSATLRGESAIALAGLLNAAPPGANPDADPTQCLHPPAPPPPDAILLVHAGAAPSTIYVTFSGCVGRKLDNGVQLARVSAAIVRAIMQPLGGGWAHSGDL